MRHLAARALPASRAALQDVQLQRNLRTAWRAERAKAYNCNDCCHPAEPYMLVPRLWVAAGMTFATGANLCLDCLEKRLRRALRSRDFTREPMNLWLRWERGALVRQSAQAAWATLGEAYRSARWVSFRKFRVAEHVFDVAGIRRVTDQAHRLNRQLVAGRRSAPTRS